VKADPILNGKGMKKIGIYLPLKKNTPQLLVSLILCIILISFSTLISQVPEWLHI